MRKATEIKYAMKSVQDASVWLRAAALDDTVFQAAEKQMEQCARENRVFIFYCDGMNPPAEKQTSRPDTVSRLRRVIRAGMIAPENIFFIDTSREFRAYLHHVRKSIVSGTPAKSRIFD